MRKLIIILGTIGAASSAIFVRYATAPSTILAMYRLFLSVLILTPMVFAFHRGEFKKITRRQLIGGIVGGVFFGLQVVLYFESLHYTSIASAAILTDTEIFVVALGELLIWKEKFSKVRTVSIFIAFAGSVIIAAGHMGGTQLAGDMIALGGAVMAAFYSLVGKACRKEMSTTVFTWIAYFFAGVVMLLGSFLVGTPLTGWGMKNFLLSLGMAIVVSLLGHSLFNWSLKYEKATFVSTIKLMGPIFAAILGYLFFREKPGVPTVIGGFVIICGVLLAMREEVKEKERAEAKTEQV